MTNLTSANKAADIKESKDLKAKLNDASANKEIFELKCKVITLKIQQMRREKAMALCGAHPKIPKTMDMLTFSTILEHILNHTEHVFLGDKRTKESETAKIQLDTIIKLNPSLKAYIKEAKRQKQNKDKET